MLLLLKNYDAYVKCIYYCSAKKKHTDGESKLNQPCAANNCPFTYMLKAVHTEGVISI
uniref:Uncharacterized protein n=1 Tax=Setaria italica TaxID=4555 RepID=K3ZBP8_SETIT